LLDEAMDYAKTVGINLSVQTADATKLPFPDNVFDLVISTRVLQHIREWHKAIQEMARVCKPGGTIVLMVYNRTSCYGFKKLI